MSVDERRPVSGPKAESADFLGRFREIVSDPLNLLIERHPMAGYVRDGLVMLHNGIRVAYDGPAAYYGSFSYILTINRGVHEPLEEYVFQELLKVVPAKPAMIELGAYWSHYSMWLKSLRPEAVVHMVEPDPANIQVGRQNFARHGFDGTFVQAAVGAGHWSLDRYLQEHGISHLDVLHSDIQGSEVEMLRDSAVALASHAIDYVFVSTHSQALHAEVIRLLGEHGYRIEVSSDFELETTSYDGLVFASSPEKAPVFPGFRPFTRVELAGLAPREVLTRILALTSTSS